MNNETLKLNSSMMEALQNHYAYSDFSIALYRYLRGCDKYWQYRIKCRVFEVLRTWSPVFDREEELYKEDPTAFWIDIAHVQSRIYLVLSANGFDFPVYSENSPF